MEKILSTDIKFLPGVGPKRAELLSKELGITTYFDLLYYFPYKYIDCTRFYKVAEVKGDMPHIQLRGRLEGFQVAGPPRKKRFVALLRDETGVIELVWFRGLSWIRDSLKEGKESIVFGRPTRYGRRINMVHPEMEEADKAEVHTGVLV